MKSWRIGIGWAVLAAGVLGGAAMRRTGPSKVAVGEASPTADSFSSALMPFGGRYGTCVSESDTGAFTVVGCNSGIAQSIEIAQVAGTPYATLQTPNGSCLTFLPNASGSYSVVEAGSCSDVTSQWLVHGGQIVSVYFSRGVNLCRDVHRGDPSGAGNALVDVTECNGTDAQVFWISGTTVGLEGALENAVDGGRECFGATAADAGIESTDCNGSDAQEWVLNANHQIARACDPSLCLGLGARLANGRSPLALQRCSPGRKDQQWYFTNASGPNSSLGRTNLVNAGTGECLDVGGGPRNRVVDVNPCGGARARIGGPFVSFRGSS